MHARLHASNEKVIEMGVGLLPPDWLKGATYGGNETVPPSHMFVPFGVGSANQHGIYCTQCAGDQASS